MTEAEWMECEETEERIEFLRSKVSDRKLRLAGCACCHLYWDEMPKSFQESVELAELYADGLASRTELDIESNKVQRLGRVIIPLADELEANYAFELVRSTTNKEGISAAMCSVAFWKKAEEIQRKWAYLYDIIGPVPFRFIIPNPTWLSPTVVALAQSTYQDRAFDRLPVLADALEEAGCDNLDILTHCRGLGPHVRGCWVVDLLLGKE